VPPILSACQVDGSLNLECPMGGVQSKFCLHYAIGRSYFFEYLGFTPEFRLDYPEFNEERVIAHLRHVRTLPKDAGEIY
jgi:hypothetical protein